MGRSGWVWSRAVIGLTCALMLVPVLIDLACSQRYRPFGYAAADTFYYLGIARGVVENGVFSTDGTHPTNGFHPLWQLIVVVIYAVCHLVGKTDLALLFAVLVSLGCIVGAIAVLGASMHRAWGRVPATFVFLPIGLYALVASYYWRVGPPDANGGKEGPLPVYGTLYSFANGMESGLTLLAFAVVCSALLRHGAASSVSAGLKCGLASAFLCLSRLDHAAFVVTPVVLWVVESFQARRRLPFLLAALAATILPIAVYCAVNLLYVGVALPISGAAKSLFPLIFEGQVRDAAQLLRAPLDAMDPARVYRVLPMLLCAFWALGYLAAMIKVEVGESSVSCKLRPFASSLDVVLVKLSPGVVLLSAYDLLYVLGVGHWYFPVSTLYCSLTALSLLRAALRRVRLPAWTPALASAVLASAVAWLFVRFHYKPGYHLEYAKFYWETAPRVRRELSGKVPKLVEIDDGIVAYSLHVPSVSGIGFLLDREASRAKRAERLFEVAYHRGFRAVSSFYYGNHGHLKQGGPPAALQWSATQLTEDLSGYTATVVYDDPTFSIVALEKSGS